MIGGVLVVFIVLMIVISRRKEKKEDEVLPTPQSSHYGMYSPGSTGSQDYYPPSYSEAYSSYQSPPSYPYPARSGSNWSKGPASAAPRSGPAYYQPSGSTAPQIQPVQERPALPMNTQTSGGVQSQPQFTLPSLQLPSLGTSPSITSPQTGVQPAEVRSPVAQGSAAGPQYMLPTLSTEEGIQNLNLKALPPVNMDTETPLGGTGAVQEPVSSPSISPGPIDITSPPFTPATPTPQQPSTPAAGEIPPTVTPAVPSAVPEAAVPAPAPSQPAEAAAPEAAAPDPTPSQPAPVSQTSPSPYPPSPVKKNDVDDIFKGAPGPETGTPPPE